MSARITRLSILPLLCVPAWGQSVHWTTAGSWPSSTFGAAIAGVGDVNGDGFEDLLVGDLDASPALLLQGRANVHSGLDGSVLYTVDGLSSLEGCGFDVSGAGDVDADGVTDFVVSALQYEPRVFSGASGVQLGVLGAPWLGDRARVAAAGDVNGDGFDDVLVGQPDAATPAGPEAGQVHVFDGSKIAAGAPDVLYSLDGNDAFGHFGWGLAGIGDVDADGRDDFAVGAPDEFGVNGPIVWCGKVHIVSGATGSVLRAHHGAPFCSYWGASIGGAGDVDLDGVPDYLIGAHGTFGGTDPGSALLYSGLTGALLHQFLGDGPGDFFGYAVRGGSDVNADGWPDLLIGAPQDDDHGNAWGSASLYSGRDFSLIYEFGGQDGQLGSAVEMLGDVDGDGIDDLALSAPTANSTFGGVWVISGECTGAMSTYCGATPNSTGDDAYITGQGSTSLSSNDLVLGAHLCPPGQPGIFFYGPTQASIPLGDGIRCVGGQIFRLFPAVTILDTGDAFHALDVTQAPASEGPGAIEPGSTWNFQFWFRDPAGPGGSGSNLSDALSVSFCQ